MGTEESKRVNKNNSSSNASRKAKASAASAAKAQTPDTVDYWLEKAKLHLDAGCLDDAIEAYQNAARIDPDCEFWVEIGERYLCDRQLEKAFIAFEQASKMDPSNAFRASYWDWLGRTREAMHDYSGALDAYSKWAIAAPDSIEPVDRSGALMVTQELWTDLPVLRNLYVERSRYKANGSSSDLNPDVLESMALYAYFLEKELGSKEEPSATELAYATLRDKYDSIAMRYLLGRIYYDLERYDSADNEFVRALKLLEKHPDWCEYRFNLDWTAKSAIFMRGKIAQKQHRYKDALNFFDESLTHSENEAGFLSDLEPIYARLRLQLDTGEIETAQAIIDNLYDMVEHSMSSARTRFQTDTANLSELPETISLDEYPELLSAIVLDKLTGWRHQMRLECALRTGKVAQAEQTLQEILELARDTGEEEAPSEAAPAKNEQSKHLVTADAALAEQDTPKAIAALKRYCKAYPDDEERLLQLTELLRGSLTAKRFSAELEQLIASHPHSEQLLEWAHRYYSEQGQRQRAKLMYMSLHAHKAVGYHPPVCEWLCPAAPDNPALIMAISARAFPGDGQIILTGGDENVAAYAHIVQSYMRSEAKNLLLEDIDKRDIHLNLRPLGRKEISLSEFNQSQQNSDEGKDSTREALHSCDENIGLAIFLAMHSALIGKMANRLTLACGTVDLYGNVGASPDLVSGLENLAQYEGECWERLILPQQIAPDLLQNGIAVWGNAEELVIGNTLPQILCALSECPQSSN
ncbi:tetratricopeptide repeat protein [bacterium]|nr:tetratricopeptide repeat protein [bacterium]